MTAIAPSRIDPRLTADQLLEARDRTFLLLAPLNDEELRTQHDALMSPILWDLGHIAYFEELWLTRNLQGPIEFVEMPGLFNPFEHPRSERGSLPLPTLDHCREIMQEIRDRVLARLAIADFDSTNPLLRDGYVYQMVLQHEYQHNETMLQTLQLKTGAPYTPLLRRQRPASVPNGRDERVVRIETNGATLGTDDRRRAYDNERPRHAAAIAPFWMDRTPVTNGEYLDFMSDGGYRRPELWSDAGRAWLTESKVEAPKYWRREHGSWLRRSMDDVKPPEPDVPVIHVCYHEAEAFA